MTTTMFRSRSRKPPTLLKPNEELCDLRADAQNPDLFFNIPLAQPCRITIFFQEFNSASRCLLLLSPCDPFPTNESAVWRLSSPDPQKTIVIHPADSNYPSSNLYLCVRYLEPSGNTYVRIKATLEPTFFGAWFHRERCHCRPSNKKSIMASAAATGSTFNKTLLRRLSDRPAASGVMKVGEADNGEVEDTSSSVKDQQETRVTSSTNIRRRHFLGGGAESDSSEEYAMEDHSAEDSLTETFHTPPQNFTRSDLYCGEWKGHLYHGRGIKFYAVSAVGQVVLEKMYNSEMLVRSMFEQRTIPWTANSLQVSFEGSITNNGTLPELDVETIKGWSVIPLMEHGMEAYDGHWKMGEKSGIGVYQWQDRAYVGEWAGGMREGHGVLEKQNGSWYRGNWHLDRRHGTGTTYDVESQTTYTGEWCNGLRCGAGRLEYLNGIVVKGKWTDDVLDPTVQAIYLDGSKYEGGWLNNCRHGEGVWTNVRECVYTNTWQCDQKQGPGSIRFPNGVIFYGTWVDDEVVEGAYHFTNGDVYTGAWREEELVREGFGRCLSKNGDIYEGEWHRDLRHGQGRMVYAKGKGTYEGQWVENVRHGRGTLQDKNGVYEGEFVQDERCGHGVQKGPDGSHYEGGWQHDFRAGAGVYYYAPDDTTYEGIFLHDRLQGNGTSARRADDDFFEGTWLDGLKQGHGTHTFPNGDILRGIWHKGKHQDGVIEYVYVDGTKFMGDWCNGQREGHGTQINADGTVYEGCWLNNQPNGHGKLTQLDGSSVECKWENGRPLDGESVLTFADGSVYRGDVVEGIPEGTGVLTYPDGTQFKGKFKNGIYLL